MLDEKSVHNQFTKDIYNGSQSVHTNDKNTG